MIISLNAKKIEQVDLNMVSLTYRDLLSIFLPVMTWTINFGGTRMTLCAWLPFFDIKLCMWSITKPSWHLIMIIIVVYIIK